MMSSFKQFCHGNKYKNVFVMSHDHSVLLVISVCSSNGLNPFHISQCNAM